MQPVCGCTAIAEIERMAKNVDKLVVLTQTFRYMYQVPLALGRKSLILGSDVSATQYVQKLEMVAIVTSLHAAK